MENKTITAYKGFDKDLKCRDFKYEIGKTYEIDGKIEPCDRGFHACEYPFDCFNYYDPANSRFCEVEQSGNIMKDDDKTVSSRIKIIRELTLAEMINIAIEKSNDVASNSGDWSVASNSGDYSVASNSGDRSVASNSGDGSVASNSGYWSVASNSGYRSVASNSGDYSVALNWGFESKAKANKGSYIALAEWVYDLDNSEYVLKGAKMRKVDGKNIKADTYYMLVDNKFVEVE